MAIFVLFHLCGAIALAVLAGKDWKDIVKLYDGTRLSVPAQYVELSGHAEKVYSATVATSVSFCMLFS